MSRQRPLTLIMHYVHVSRFVNRRWDIPSVNWTETFTSSDENHPKQTSSRGDRNSRFHCNNDWWWQLLMVVRICQYLHDWGRCVETVLSQWCLYIHCLEMFQCNTVQVFLLWFRVTDLIMRISLCKTVVTLLLLQWSCYNLTLSHRCGSLSSYRPPHRLCS